jgi:hypothetical protein
MTIYLYPYPFLAIVSTQSKRMDLPSTDTLRKAAQLGSWHLLSCETFSPLELSCEPCAGIARRPGSSFREAGR